MNQYCQTRKQKFKTTKLIHLYPDFKSVQNVYLKPGFLVLKIEYSGPMSASWATGTPKQGFAFNAILSC